MKQSREGSELSPWVPEDSILLEVLEGSTEHTLQSHPIQGGGVVVFIHQASVVIGGVLPGEGKFSSTSLPCLHPVSSSYQEKLSDKEVQVLSVENGNGRSKVPGVMGEASIASTAMARTRE